MGSCRLLGAIQFFLLIVATSAFLAPVPARSLSTRTLPIMSIRVEDAGAIPPTGYFDPLGFMADGDELKFRRYRAAEIKHGRVAQLAALHYLVTYFFRLPGDLGGVPISSIPYGWGALKVVPFTGWALILLFASILELLTAKNERRGPGKVHPRASTFLSVDDQEDKLAMDCQNKELSNGRLAMIAVVAMWAHSAVTGGEHPIATLLNWLA